MVRADLAVIGGTGVYRADMLEESMEIEVQTSYGSVSLRKGSLKGREIAFLARHGKGHTVPPHLINYRANISALKSLGVKRIIATAAVGSLNEKMKPLDLVIVDQFLDFTKGRESTFYEGGEKGVLHVDMTEPYCAETARFIYGQARALDLPAHLGGCYVATEGPRFETPAEIRMFRLLGGDVVGMTGVPEAVLAREAGMCYASIAMVTNYAAGISPAALSHGEVVEAVKSINANVSRLIMAVLENIPLEPGCRCGRGPEEAGKL